ncbi:hypothetical protein MNBD_ALPHA06-2233 [hydrothermal vent metagenome]|uniref:N-acetyltransferase domain-containing protein n=1 Tax=hydrothermal vent metagenome TaxID=652676 RepID=A0A3B0SX82_9ZZZZ
MGLRATPIPAKDAARLAAVHQRCFAQSWSDAEFASLMQNPTVQGLGLVEDDRDIGLALLQNVASETEILTFGIIPARRGNGMGYFLLDAVADMARASGSSALFLEVSATNLAAVHLYQGYGFEQISTRAAYYADRSDAWIFRLAL